MSYSVSHNIVDNLYSVHQGISCNILCRQITNIHENALLVADGYNSQPHKHTPARALKETCPHARLHKYRQIFVLRVVTKYGFSFAFTNRSKWRNACVALFNQYFSQWQIRRLYKVKTTFKTSNHIYIMDCVTMITVGVVVASDGLKQTVSLKKTRYVNKY